MRLIGSFDLIPMPPDFRDQANWHLARSRRLALESPCPVCEAASDTACDPKQGPLTPGGMHWGRYLKDEERIEGKNA